MNEKLYQPKNNLFQSEYWQLFQKSIGRKIVEFGDFWGVELSVAQKKFVILTKSPQELGKKEIKVIKEKLAGSGVIFVRTEPLKVTANSDVKEVVPGSLLFGQKSPKATLVLNLLGSEEEILNQMKPKTRYNIRLAEKKGVKIRKAKSKEDVESFYRLLSETSQKTKGAYSPYNQDYYQKMFEVLGEKAIWIYLAEYKKQPVAGILVSQCGEVGIYLHGGSSENYRNLMAPYLCHWEAILDLKKAGVKIYDFWGIAETDNPSDPWAGITRFKTGFGGQNIVFPGAYDVVLSRFWYNVLNLLARIKRMARKCLKNF